MPLATLTAEAVADLFRSLSPEDQQRCLKLIDFTPEGIFLAVDALSPQDRWKFSSIVFEQIVGMVFPWMIDNAIDVVRSRPAASKEELHALVNEETRKAIEQYQAAHTELATARLKEQRDRKSDPNIVARNVEICDRRRAHKKKWTLGRLAKQYGITRQTVVRILEQEVKWRRLAKEM